MSAVLQPLVSPATRKCSPGPIAMPMPPLTLFRGLALKNAEGMAASIPSIQDRLEEMAQMLQALVVEARAEARAATPGTAASQTSASSEDSAEEPDVAHSAL